MYNKISQLEENMVLLYSSSWLQFLFMAHLVGHFGNPSSSLGPLVPFGSHILFSPLRTNFNVWYQNSFLRVSLVSTFRTKSKQTSRAHETLHNNSSVILASSLQLPHRPATVFAVRSHTRVLTLTYPSMLGTLSFQG